ncbi:MAG: response regulator transcription factor [Bacteroidetes bacterium]|nr:MAG: response regulator transcription factor [Bacteroidota bacterium]
MKIIIADDHILVRKGLRQVLEGTPDLEVFEAENGEEALQFIRSEAPAVALLDVEMPRMTGFDVARRVQAEGLPTALVFLTMFKEESVFNKAMDLGVKGYVLKENTITEVIQCVRAVAEGRYYLSPSISDFFVRRNSRLAVPGGDSLGLGKLTPAERNVLKLVAAMKSNQQIADALGISVKTVQNHRNNICDKLGLSGAHALLKFSLEHSSLI